MAHIHRVIVTAGFRCAVQGKVLHTSHHGVGGSQIGPLIALYHGLRNATAQIGVLAAAFAHAPPPGLAADVHHGAECPGNSVGSGLNGGNAGRIADGIHVPAHRQGKGDGENGLVTVNYIHAENERDVQAALLHGDALHLLDFIHSLEVEQSAHLSGLDFAGDVAALGRAGDDFAGDGQVELPNFLLQGHLAHQVINKLVHFGLVHGICAEGSKHQKGRYE